MLRLEDYKTIFIVVSIVGSLIIASPILASVIPKPATEAFSELYVLGAGGMVGGYPTNVEACETETYKVFLGVGNHLGFSAYYELRVKLRNPNEPLPNSTSGTPSPLPSIYEKRVILGDNQTSLMPLHFSFGGLSFNGNSCRVSTISMNNQDLSINKTIPWDSEKKAYSFEMFFELWIFDTNSGSFLYHNRFVGFWLNITSC